MTVDREDLVATIADELAIAELVRRYGLALDAQDVEMWLECFAAGATMAISTDRPRGAGFVPDDERDVFTITGVESLRTWIAQFCELHPRPHLSKHLLFGSNSEVSGDTARVVTNYANARSSADGGVLIQTAGRYLDRVERGADRKWRFIERQIIRDLGFIPAEFQSELGPGELGA